MRQGLELYAALKISLFLAVFSACTPAPLVVELPLEGASSALLMARGGELTTIAAIDPIAGADAECLRQIGDARLDRRENALRLDLLMYQAPLAELCVPSPCFSRSESGREVPAPWKIRSRIITASEDGVWTDEVPAPHPLPLKIDAACLSPPSPARIVKNGSLHTCAILEDGSLWCWGDNRFGQLGNGSAGNEPRPIRVPGIENVRQLAIGYFTTCVVSGSGTVKCWGENRWGQVGVTANEHRPLPIDVPAIDDAIDIALGRSHSCILRRSGRVACWGANFVGQLGDGTNESRHEPRDIPNFTGATAIACGDGHSCALVEGGRLFCWGPNGEGNLGLADLVDRNVPTEAPGLSSVVQLALGARTTCARFADGVVQCFGYNRFGQLGRPVNGQIDPTPAPAVGLARATDLAMSGMNVCAVQDAQPWCWGRSYGGLPKLLPLEGREIEGVATGAAAEETNTSAGDVLGRAHVCARSSDGAVFCAGGNPFGQLGDGSFDDRADLGPVLW